MMIAGATATFDFPFQGIQPPYGTPFNSTATVAASGDSNSSNNSAIPSGVVDYPPFSLH
jgi:hypothetical protein